MMRNYFATMLALCPQMNCLLSDIVSVARRNKGGARAMRYLCAMVAKL
jgi:hypothetical protein